MAELKTFVKKAVMELIKEEYPHLLYPATVVGMVNAVVQTNGGYVYTIGVLSPSGNLDDDYPEIPGVTSEMAYEPGEKVAVAFLYGSIRPYIMGRVIT